MNNKKYLTELIAELKRFLALPHKEREKAAIDLCDGWQPSTKGYSGLAWETINVAAPLTNLHEYCEEPGKCIGIVRDMLIDAEEQLKLLNKKLK